LNWDSPRDLFGDALSMRRGFGATQASWCRSRGESLFEVLAVERVEVVKVVSSTFNIILMSSNATTALA
jgi:hypothetical protein